MNKIDSFIHVVHTRYTVLDKDVKPGTIIVNIAAGLARWQCPCGCGNVSKVAIAECKVFGLCDRYNLPEKTCGYEFDKEGSISFSEVFTDTRCPNGYVYGIEHNNVIVYAEKGPVN